MILIYSNSGEWGGVDVLIARFAQHLLKTGVNFKILEPVGGRLRTQVPEDAFVEFSELTKISKEIEYVFCPSVLKLRDPKFPWDELCDARLLSWIVHPNDVFRGFFPLSATLMNWFGYSSVKPLRIAFRAHAEIFDAYFDSMLKSDSLIAMDGATVRALHYFVNGANQAPLIVPIPGNVTACAERKSPDEVIRVGYLGRMDATKWSAVEPFIRHQLAPLSAKCPVEFVLVTEGSMTTRLVALCGELGVPCRIEGYMPNDVAISWLMGQTDVGVAMGTSALDIAGAGHPCIVIDPILKPSPRSQRYFRFIQESTDFTLGEFRDFPGYIHAERSFENCVLPSVLEKAAVDGRNYVKKSHNPEVCFNELLKCIFGSALTVGDAGRATTQVLDSLRKTRVNPLLALFE